jgi:cytochrome bd-type quinol oxidase subunit 2
MKKLLHILRPATLIGIGLLLALTSAALGQPAFTGSTASMGAFASLAAQSTATPPVVPSSEIGSTDGLVFVSVLIVLIIIAPILLRWKAWSHR